MRVYYDSNLFARKECFDGNENFFPYAVGRVAGNGVGRNALAVNCYRKRYRSCGVVAIALKEEPYIAG